MTVTTLNDCKKKKKNHIANDDVKKIVTHRERNDDNRWDICATEKLRCHIETAIKAVGKKKEELQFHMCPYFFS